MSEVAERLPAVTIPSTYGDLYSFMTIVGNGPHGNRRYGVMDTHPGFRENEYLLLQTMSSPDAMNKDKALPADVVQAARLHLGALEGKTSTGAGITATVGHLITQARAFGNRLFGGGGQQTMVES